MIQRHTLDGGRFPRRAPGRSPPAAAREQRPADADAAGHRHRHPPRLPRGRRGHHRDQHVQRHRRWRRPTTRPSTSCGTSTCEARPPGPRRGRRVDRADARQAALRGRARSARPTGMLSISPDVEDPAAAGDHLRRAAGRLRRAGAGPDRGRRRPAAGGDDHRHASNAKAALFAIDEVAEETGTPPAGDDLGHDHRPQRAHAGRPDDRGLLDHDRARAPLQRRA